MPRPRTTPSWCENLGVASFDSASNFTLAAFNITTPSRPPFTQPGEPLVIGTTKTLTAASVGVLVTAATYANDSFPSYNLTSGALLPLASAAGLNITEQEAAGVPTFTWSGEQHELDPAAQIFCAVPNIDAEGGGNPNPQLAIDQDLDGFNLCMNELGYNQVVHSPSAEGAGQYPTYDLDSCYAVTVHLMGIVEDD